MSKLSLRISMSFDGYTSGPNQSLKDPLGVGAQRIHEWVFGLRVWRAAHGMTGGEDNRSSEVLAAEIANVGATIIGRHMFGGHPGGWDSEKPWQGWWGEKPPFHHPVFVVTHHQRPPLTMEGGTTFHFVTEGIESALTQARRAAGAKDIALAGGATICRQYLTAGLVDEMLIHQAPILLGSGERLFEGVSDLHGLELVETVAEPNVTHFKFLKR
jgi:dihydrofolate reductase